MKKFTTLFLLPVILVLFFVFQDYQKTIQGFTGGKRVDLNIPYNTNEKEIIEILYKKGVIAKQWPVLLYLKWYKDHPQVQAGDFIIQRGLSVDEVLKVLSNAKAKETAVTIIPGSTIEDINNVLVRKNLVKDNEFLDCLKNCDFSSYSFLISDSLESYLYPDTYFVTVKNFNVEDFIKRLLNNFNRKVIQTLDNKDLKDRSLTDMIIMASLLEKEERNTNNMPIISGILWKRLDEGMPLGVDATTRYFEKKKTEALTFADFAKDNPYNLRKRKGLPPTAISNFDILAFKAALNPEKSDYYYYLHDQYGQIHYGRNHEEHLVNKRKYIK